MRLNKPNPETTIQITVRDLTHNTSKSRTVYDTTIEDVYRILESGAADYDPDHNQTGQHIDVTA